MVNKVETATIKLWGKSLGAISWLDDKQHAVFEYEPSFLTLGLDVSPIHMSLQAARDNHRIFSFPALNKSTFLGLPGLLADSLPDKFGNHIIDIWLSQQGRHKNSFSPVERLCYTGNRGMGALEFSPAVTRKFDNSVSVDVAQMVELVQNLNQQRSNLSVDFGDSDKHNAEAIADILRIGTSAGGARAKAVIAMNEAGQVVSGQTDAPRGYDYWLLKFDGVNDLELGESIGFGRIEFAYYLMAKAAGIEMTDCRLLEENNRAHFLTKRFDRMNGEKAHLQSLCGIAHYDFNMAGAYSYEQVFMIMRQLRLSKAEALQQFRRMVFNIVARNQDDHTKNIGFIMSKDGAWRLSPAFDVTYAHNPAGLWTNQHQLSVSGKRDNITRDDLIELGDSISLNKPGLVIDEVVSAVSDWQKIATQVKVNKKWISEIAATHRLSIGKN